jgi:hypothetical protein
VTKERYEQLGRDPVWLLMFRFFWQLAVIVPWTIVGWHLALDILIGILIGDL